MFHICVPCMNQAIEFNKVRDQFDENQVAIIGINTNGDSKEAILNYLSKFSRKSSFPLFNGSSEIFLPGNFSQRDMPTVLVMIKKEF
ncbi:MAG: hypothetical protein Ct9H300mP23_02520 [Nitrospinota bacterium]|nr:MAG: hypothetical protein Ct9H300mP23_02520 [Nitrospinota bacterium]